MTEPIKAPPAVLSFAATDPSGGAGIQADILTLASMGCHPLSVITAITVQNTSGVEAISPLDADLVADQARAILEDVPVAAFKIGVLGSAENVAAIAEIVSDYPEIPLILDPVLASRSRLNCQPPQCIPQNVRFVHHRGYKRVPAPVPTARATSH